MENIRNFCIIAHIDAGKSTLSDRFLEITGTVPENKMMEQFLDSMNLERGRGITIKMHPVRMDYLSQGKNYILNLIDTPGHVDFNYEVSRSLAAVEGAILLVDATKGIQAQTAHNLELAKKQGLVIIPAINKIDSPQALIEESKESLSRLLDIDPNDIFLVSAKKGSGTKELLEAVIEKIPCPKGEKDKPFRALIFDSKFDAYKGIIAFIRVIDGAIEAGKKFILLQSQAYGEAKELGYFKPEMEPKKEGLKTGEIGYLATGFKETGKVRVGDTVSNFPEKSEALPGYQVPKPVVFASVYPENQDNFENLKEALYKLKLNDSSFTFEQESKEALGRGFRCGFLGSLHAEIVSERLKNEFNLGGLIISNPSVVFEIINQKNEKNYIFSSSDWPDSSEIKEAREPWAELEIIVPPEYLGRVMEILGSLKVRETKTDYLGLEKIKLTCQVPFKGIVFGFYDTLKGATQGFASMNYMILDYRPAELVKMEVYVAGKKEEAFSKIIYKEAAFEEGKKITSKLKEVLPHQLFSVAIQAVVSGKIISRETISAKRRDVIAPLYGGDYTRKRKLLEKQKKGKKNLKEKGKVRIPAKVFLEVFKSF
jgi:GTP-binding protein LepA